jgi:hypothetical protein
MVIYIDNNNFDGDWDEESFGKERVIFEGRDEKGNYGRYTMTGERVDKKNGVLYVKRGWFKRTANGEEKYTEYIGKKHPVSAEEVMEWLTMHNFEIIHFFGDRKGNPYTKESNRAIFRARKKE